MATKTSQLGIHRHINENAVLVFFATAMAINLCFAQIGPICLRISIVLFIGVFTLLALKNLQLGLNFFVLFIPAHLVLLVGLKNNIPAGDVVVVSMVKDFLIFVLLYCFLLRLVSGKILLPKSPFNVLILLFAMITLIFSFYSPTMGASLYGLRSQWEFLAFYFLAIGVIKTVKDVRNVVYSFLFGGLLITVYAFIVLLKSKIAYGYEFGWLPQHIVGRLTVLGGPETSGFFATYLSTVAMILAGFVLFYKPCLSKKSYSMVLVLFMICIVGTIFTFTRRAWVASFAAIMIISFLAKKIKFIASMLLLLTVIMFASYICSPKATGILYDRLLSISDVDNFYNTPRIDEWKNLLARAKSSHFLGEGLGTVGSVGTRLNITDSTNTHNYYLAVLVQTGFLGLLSFVSIAIAALYFVIKSFLMAETPFLKAVTAGTAMAFISLLVQNMFSLTTEVYPFNLYYWFLTGLGVALFAIVRRNATQSS